MIRTIIAGFFLSNIFILIKRNVIINHSYINYLHSLKHRLNGMHASLSIIIFNQNNLINNFRSKKNKGLICQRV